MFQNSKYKSKISSIKSRVPVKKHNEKQQQKHDEQLLANGKNIQNNQVDAVNPFYEVVEVYDGKKKYLIQEQREIEEQDDTFLKVVEVYDEVLDLRQPIQEAKAFRNFSEPNARTSKANKLSVRNSIGDFDITTNVIAQRIVSKQKELRKSKEKKQSAKPVNMSQVPQMFNRLVIERILETEAKLKGNKQSSSRKIHKTKVNSSSAGPKKCTLETKSIQVTIADSYRTIKSAIDNDIVNTRNVALQVNPDRLTKKLQTRLYKMSDIESNPISFDSPSKFTNTAIQYPFADQGCQSYEYMSSGELFCLDWVDRHLFDVHINSHNIILDEKIKELSEIATKSTLFSDEN